MIKNAMVIDPAWSGHEYELLTRAGKVGASTVIRLKDEHALKTSTAHTTLRKLSRDHHGQTVMIEIDLLDKDPEWWVEKLHNCGFVMSTTSTALVREATKWTDVWVCLCS